MAALPPPPRIAITGIGVVSPFGVGRERYWDHVSRGVSGTRAIDEFDTSSFACQVAAPLPAISIDEAPTVLPATQRERQRPSAMTIAPIRAAIRAPRSPA